MASCELVLRFRGRRVETEDELIEIEDALVELLVDGEAFEGHEVGEESRDICLATDDAEATFARIAPFLARAALLDHVVAAARPLRGDAFTTIWPVA